jgi:hypothetical protein
MLLVVILLYSLAGIFEAAGLLLAGRGFYRTWSEFGTGESLRGVTLGPVARRASAGVAWVEHWVSRLLRRPVSARVHAVAADATIHMTARVTARVDFGPLPSVLEDPEQFAAEVHRRIQSLHEKVQATQDSIGDESGAREQEAAELRSQLDARAGEIEQLSKTVAVGGLVDQIYGWLLIVAGVALGTLGNLIQAAH